MNCPHCGCVMKRGDKAFPGLGNPRDWICKNYGCEVDIMGNMGVVELREARERWVAREETYFVSIEEALGRLRKLAKRGFSFHND